MRHRGFTLVELLVVITLVAILASIATLNWSRMFAKSNIEGQIKTLHADLLTVRAQALYSKRSRAVSLSGKIFRIYSSDVTASVNPIETKTGKYNYIVNGSGSVITFDTSGMATGSERSICLDPFNDTTIVNDAAVDSVVVSQARIIIGKRTGGNCVTTNISQK